MSRFVMLSLSAAFAISLGTPAFSQSSGAEQAQNSSGGYADVTLRGKLFASKNASDFSHDGAGSYTFRKPRAPE